jgi:ATP-dependent protease ClpP protease subunit
MKFWVLFWIFFLSKNHCFNISNIRNKAREQILNPMKKTAQTFLMYNSLNSEDDEEDDKTAHYKKSYVSKLENTIYFYSPINADSSIDLERKLININDRNLRFLHDFDQSLGPIHLHIQSFGGSLFHTLYLIDLIQNMETPVYTYVDGFAASAGTLLSICGEKRYMSKHSLMLIHQLSSSVSGKFSELKDDYENNELLMESIVNLYLEKSKLSKYMLDELLNRDIWLNSTKCLEYGFVDEIV